MSQNTTLVQVMAWCCQAPSHYLNQCWPRSPSLYGTLGHKELIQKNRQNTARQNILWTQNRSISQVSQCIRQMSHNAPFCNRNVHISVTKWCIVGYGTGALWDLCDRSIHPISGPQGQYMGCLLWESWPLWAIQRKLTHIVMGLCWKIPLWTITESG